MKKLIVSITLTIVASQSNAQYKGGSDDGFRQASASSLSLATASMYSGGNDDGHGQASANAVSLSTNSQYSGGSNDGAANVAVSSLSLSGSSSYSGGSDDGQGAVSATAISLVVQNMYNGGSNDGEGLVSASSLSMGTNTSYSGGADDGASGLLSSGLNLGISSMYSGGINDGAAAITQTAVALAPNSNMYFGGTNDGFSSYTASALPIVPLPITWEDFTAVRNGKDALLQWQVGNERNDAGFELQRSYDGAVFEKISFIKAGNAISGTGSYEYTDADPAQHCLAESCNKVFYRIRAIALSGSYTFSPIKRLPLDEASLAASVYPNPASDKINIRINQHAGAALAYSISMYNSLGVQVLARTDLSAATYELDVRELPSGSYFLRLISAGKTYPYLITITH